MASRSRSRAEWTRLVEEMKSTGETVTEFARRKRLNESTLSNWRWRLRKEAEEQATVLPSFVEVELAVEMDAPAARGSVVASLPNGVTLRFDHDLSGSGLRALVEAVGGAECGR